MIFFIILNWVIKEEKKEWKKNGEKYIITLSKHVLAEELLSVYVSIRMGVVGLHKILGLKIS